jgi:hypothetical protein
MDGEVVIALLALALLGGPWVLAIVALVKLGRAKARIAALESAMGLAPPRPAPAWGPGAAPAAAAPPQPAAATPAGPPPPTADPAPLSTSVVTPRPALPGAASLEEKIALVWFTRLGALALLMGAGYFFKYAVDNAWIGPAGRVALGALAGAGAIAAGELLRARTRALWVNAVQGAGVALLLVATFAAAALYRLIPFPAAFAAVAVVALAGGALAVRGRAELVLALSLAGALLAPVILSTGEDRPVALLGWLLAAAAPALLVSARLGFLWVPWLALAGTAVLFAGWYDRFFRTFPPPPLLDPNLPAALQQGAYHALAPRLGPLALLVAHAAAWLLAWERLRRTAPRPWADAWLAVALGAGHVAPFYVLADRPLAVAAAVSAGGLVAAALAARAGRPWLHLGAAALGGVLVAIGIGEAQGEPVAAWIAAAAAWALVHLAAAGRALLVAPAEAPARASLPHVLCCAVAGLGFAGLAVQATGPEDGLLRAALAGAAAVAELALGAAVLPRGRARATALLGAALALTAGAAAFLLSGASVTLAWAALAATAAVLAAREREPLWMAGAALLFVATLSRLLGVDVPGPERDAWRFLGTFGAEGALRPAPLLGGRALALLGTGVALLLPARSAARAGGRWRAVAAALASAGHACLLGLAVLEVRNLALSLPPPPAAGDALAFAEYRPLYEAALEAQAGKLDTVTTLALGAYAALLVAVGFAARELLHRWLGLVLFAATLAKLALSDVWRLSRPLQIVAFTALGALLLAAAFLYARFGRRILGLLREPPGPGAALVLAAAGLALAAPARGADPAAPARALDPAPFATARSLLGVDAKGLHAVRVDAALFRASLAAPGTLADVRIAGPDGAEVPFAIRPVDADRRDERVGAELVDPVVLAGGATRAVLDKGRRGLRTTAVALDLEGDDFLRPVRVESSEDGRRFGTLVEGGRVYAVRGLPEARRTEIEHPASDARFLRVTVLPGEGDPPRVLGATLLRRAPTPPAHDGLDLGAPPRRAGPDGRTSLFDVDLGARGLPVAAVVLSVATPAFERCVRVLGSDDGETFATLGAAVVHRAGDDASLRIPVAPAGRRHLRLEVRDGDAPPLDLRGLRVEWRARELVLDPARAGPHVLYAGAAGVAAPAYDLGAVLARTPGAALAPASLGPAAPNPRHAPVEPARPFTERHREALGVGVAAVLAGLALWAVRLLRRGSAGPDAGT